MGTRGQLITNKSCFPFQSQYEHLSSCPGIFRFVLGIGFLLLLLYWEFLICSVGEYICAEFLKFKPIAAKNKGSDAKWNVGFEASKSPLPKR